MVTLSARIPTHRHPTLGNCNGLTNDRLDGAYCLLNMTWNSCTYQKQRWSSLMHSHDGRIFVLKITRTTLTKPFYQMASLSVPSHLAKKNQQMTLNEPCYQTTYFWTPLIWIFTLGSLPAQTGTVWYQMPWLPYRRVELPQWSLPCQTGDTRTALYSIEINAMYPMRNSEMIPRPTPHGPPWPPEDFGTATTWLLVAQDAHIHEELCRWMCCLSAGKDKLAPNRPTSDAYQRLHYRMTLCPDLLQFHHWFTSLRRFWFSHGCGRPWAFKGGNFMPLSQDHRRHRNYRTPHSECLPKIWPAR